MAVNRINTVVSNFLGLLSCKILLLWQRDKTTSLFSSRLIQTLSMAPSVTVLTGIDCTDYNHV